jgi:XRE family aerobic/anaerobic benzoate catabolism transcriptional regulator
VHFTIADEFNMAKSRTVHMVNAARAQAEGRARPRGALLASLGRALRALRRRHGLTRQALASAAGLSARFLAQLESGEGNVSVAKLERLARALGLAPAALLAAAGDGGEAGESADGGRPALLAALMDRLLRAPASRLEALLREWEDEPAAPGAAPRLIALVGLRGAGKSTLGPRLARRLGLAFHELDELIAEGSGLALPEIFEMHGESYYREAERRALGALIARGEPAVIAVSGGIVTDPEALALLKGHTRLIWLKATPEQHMARVEAQGDYRPMRNRPNAMAELQALLRARTPLYEQAHAVVDTSAGPEASLTALVAAVVPQ